MSAIERRVCRVLAVGLMSAIMVGGLAAASQAAPGTQGLCPFTGSNIVVQVNLVPPHQGGNARGVASILKERFSDCLTIVARGLAPNNRHNAYAVWLDSAPRDARLLGFANPEVRRDGELQTEGVLPRHWRRFHHLVISLETSTKPRRPHHIVLSGNLHKQPGFTG